MHRCVRGVSFVMYSVFEAERFQRDLDALGPEIRKRIEKKLRRYVYPQLEGNPRSGPNIKRLQVFDPITWRYRVGEWRFFYFIDEAEKVVSMLAVHHRGQAYR